MTTPAAVQYGDRAGGCDTHTGDDAREGHALSPDENTGSRRGSGLRGDRRGPLTGARTSRAKAADAQAARGRARTAGLSRSPRGVRWKATAPRSPGGGARADPGDPPRCRGNTKASSTHPLRPPACPGHAAPSFLAAASMASAASTSPAPRVWGQLPLGLPRGGVCRRSVEEPQTRAMFTQSERPTAAAGGSTGKV